ncbi:hypothetical protein CKAH01_00064 [Colletotrichum kahawae]|uniref:Uncharacterized protein n=1 Tax=Colletotrichum kahawae TaxID=34407 RepID=A0AAD9YU58_COLKA|nr:hypothetical protein CKAH01_00064 [Colletotrichum kahawae]
MNALKHPEIFHSASCGIVSCLGASRRETASKPSLVSTEIEAVIGSWGSALSLEPPGHGVSIFTKGGLGGDDDDIDRKCATGSLTMREGLDGQPAGTPGGGEGRGGATGKLNLLQRLSLPFRSPPPSLPAAAFTIHAPIMPLLLLKRLC